MGAKGQLVWPPDSDLMFVSAPMPSVLWPEGRRRSVGSEKEMKKPTHQP